jgi:5-methylcytosine-specific restriction endonuclease McrA
VPLYLVSIVRIGKTDPADRRAALRRAIAQARPVPAAQARPARVVAICALCGGPIFDCFRSPHDYSYTADHIWPEAKGGPDVPANWQPAHRICNLRKSDRLPTPAAVNTLLARLRAEAGQPPLRVKARARRVHKARRILTS